MSNTFFQGEKYIAGGASPPWLRAWSLLLSTTSKQDRFTHMFATQHILQWLNLSEMMYFITFDNKQIYE